MKGVSLMVIGLLCLSSLSAQWDRSAIYTDYVLFPKRAMLEQDLRGRIIGRNFMLPLDSNTEDKFSSSCEAVMQFLFYSPEVEKGFHTLFTGYDSLSYDTKLAFLEAVYAVAPGSYADPMRKVLDKETNPKLFAIGAVYLYRLDSGMDNSNSLKIRMTEKFPGYDTIPLLLELQDYLSYHAARPLTRTPAITELFTWQSTLRQKIVYSFQRWDRNYPGLAIVQGADGSFVRDEQGRVKVFQQLARSGPDLPYFITNGSTPQGVYCIQGTAVSHTNFIGPTPNLQLLLPFEESWDRFFHLSGYLSDSAGIDSIGRYRGLLPPAWRNYAPMMESWAAGRIGRTEIIAHGTTIDPEYYKGRPFYPLTPTMGCLCAREIWNSTSGRLSASDQLDLVNAFVSAPAAGSTPPDKGYLLVVNVDDQRKPLSPAEVENWVRQYEAGKGGRHH